VFEVIGEILNRIRTFWRRDLWSLEVDPGSLAGRALSVLRFSVMVGEGFVQDHLLLRASALTYFMVLSLIPLLALVIAILGSVGLGGTLIESLVAKVVEQLAAGAPEAQAQILDLISKVNFAALGSVGAASLFVTTILGITNVERSFNAIWGVSQDRSWARRLPDYLAVLIVAPLLGGTALSLAGTLDSQMAVQKLIEYPMFALAHEIGLRQAPTVVLALAFGFIYWFLPNTRVRVSSAALAGLVAAVLVLVAQHLYLGLSVGAARSNVLFGGLAALPLLFVWMYFFWAIVLLGAEVAFAHQNLETYRVEVHGGTVEPAQREAIGLRIAVEVARSFRDGPPHHDAEQLAGALRVPVRTVRDLLDRLCDADLLAPRADDDRDRGFLLGRPAEQIQLGDVLAALRGERSSLGGDAEVNSTVEGLLAELQEGAAKGPAGLSLAEILQEIPPLPRV
jgi:membrane protein